MAMILEMRAVLATLCTIVTLLLVRLVYCIILGYRRSLVYTAVAALCGCVGICLFVLGAKQEPNLVAPWYTFGSKLSILIGVHMLQNLETLYSIMGHVGKVWPRYLYIFHINLVLQLILLSAGIVMCVIYQQPSGRYDLIIYVGPWFTHLFNTILAWEAKIRLNVTESERRVWWWAGICTLITILSTAFILAAAILVATQGKSGKAKGFVVVCFVAQTCLCTPPVIDKDMWMWMRRTQRGAGKNKERQKNNSATALSNMSKFEEIGILEIPIRAEVCTNPAPGNGSDIELDQQRRLSLPHETMV